MICCITVVSVAIDSDNRDVSTGSWSNEELLGGMFRSCGPRCVPLDCGFFIVAPGAGEERFEEILHIFEGYYSS